MKLVVAGAAGRMGRTLIKAIHDKGLTVAGAFNRAGSEFIGQDAGILAGVGALGVTITDDPLPLMLDTDGVIDFTTPALSLQIAELAAQARIVHVIGTTGFSNLEEAALKAASQHARIVKSGNMSLGVNLLAMLVKKVAQSLDEDFDIEVLEMHHKHKVDAPSGTALLLGKAASDGRNVDLKDTAVYSREGITGARKAGDIGFATLRGGSVVGDHTVIFAGDKERIELSHKAEDRGLFANGALKAALWAQDKKPGLYSMFDVLNLND